MMGGSRSNLSPRPQRSKLAILILAALAAISFHLLQSSEYNTNQASVRSFSPTRRARALLLSENFSCKWSPWSSDHGLIPLVEDLGLSAESSAVCLQLLTERLPPRQLQPRRWVFMGDSTMSRLFQLSSLKHTIVDSPLEELEKNQECFHHISCQKLQGERCELNDLFDLPYPEHWVPPHRMIYTDLAL